MLLQDNGRIILAGYTSSLLNGKIRAFYNTEPATQLLTYTNSTITWLRGGTSPELSFVTFEHSADQTNWTFLGHGVRLFEENKSVGWQLNPVSPLFGSTFGLEAILLMPHPH